LGLDYLYFARDTEQQARRACDAGSPMLNIGACRRSVNISGILNNIRIMNQLLKLQLENLPSQPGIYQFFNAAGKLLYVGKAKILKNRVRSYFQSNSQLTPSKQEMVEQIHHLKTTVVDNADEALLFESALIKQHQPPYNIIFKDDKNWLYLMIDYKDDFPKVELTRRRGQKNVKWFGPYTSASAIRQTFHLLKKILGLKTCLNPPDKPCFGSTIGRCLGHNLGPGAKNIYLAHIKQLEQFLKGNSQLVKEKLQAEMTTAAQTKRFEQAARLRDSLKLLDRILTKQKIISTTKESFDVINLASQNNLSAINILPIKQGVLLEGDQILIEHDKKLTPTDILTDFIERYYPQVTDKPKKIFVPVKLPGVGFKIDVPQRGYKRQLLKLSQANAANYLSNSLASWQKQTNRAKTGLDELTKILRLKTLPLRIEGYDISNIQGQHAVGAMVVLTKGLIDKSQYRKFIIKKVNGPNDVAMLAEVLARRFKRRHQGWPKPDLIMLDGGKPQLNTIMRIFKKKKIGIPLVALAKKEELLFSPNQKAAIHLPANSPGLLLLEQLRDEAHRFGITFYRARHRQTVKND